MSHLPSPLCLEINCRPWLRQLSDRLQRPATLGSVPDECLQEWEDAGFTHVWLMGVWSIGPRARQVALDDRNLQDTLDRLLPGWKADTVCGSPFAPNAYRVPDSLGGEDGLRQFRSQLANHQLRLILDFIPNHVGIDHPWVTEHPDYFVQSPTPAPGTFEISTPQGTIWIAHGKDPNFPPWIDTAQLDYRCVATHRAVARAFDSVAKRCDGVRCDMAMLLLREVFEQQWKEFPCPQPAAEGEFWANLIRHARHAHPDLLLMAEAYWNLEPRLQELGFDFTYDKKLYDHVVAREPAAVRRHLSETPPPALSAGVHFIENHDEPRIASLLHLPEHRTAALTILGLPGFRLLHERQLFGARHFQPIHINQPIPEMPDAEITAFYRHLLHALRASSVGQGHAELLQTRPAWPDNLSNENFVVIQWRSEIADFDLVVINLAAHRCQCYVQLTAPGLAQRNWSMTDLLGPEEYRRYGDDLEQQGLYLDVAGHAAQLFHFAPLS